MNMNRKVTELPLTIFEFGRLQKTDPNKYCQNFLYQFADDLVELSEFRTMIVA